MELYTGQQLVNTIDAIRYYLKNYPEKFHESMIEKHLKNLTPIELPSDEEIREVMELFENEMDDFDLGFRNGVQWLREKIQGGEQ